MLKKILSISGRPGLYQLVSYGKNMLVVDTIPAGHRFPVHSRERVMAFTVNEDVPLTKVFENTGKKFDNKAIDANEYSTPEKLHEFMSSVLENWDTERVHNNDIKRIISWYNILVGAGITDFTAKEEEETQEAAEEEKKD